MRIYHDSHSLIYRRPFGAAEASSAVTLSLLAENAVSAVLRLWRDGVGETVIPMERDGALFTATAVMPPEGGLVWYYFRVTDGDGRTWFYGNNGENAGGEGEIYDREPPSYQITVYKSAPVPKWYKDAVVYQIFPDRFRRGEDWLERVRVSARPEERKGPRRIIQQDWNDTPFYSKDEKGDITRWPFFGGTLEGVREKLPYLRSLGVTALYFNPIFKAASNHRYDTADYMAVDPMLGDEESFAGLITEAERMGISVILDGVFSHTGADSPYFDLYGNYENGAYGHEDSPYRSWYNFNSDKPTGYDCWWGVADLPNVNELDEGYMEYICGENGVIRRWLRAGARGWRLDVADELPDEFIAALRRAVKAERDDAVLIGEVWEDASNKRSYGVSRRYLFGDELDAAMNYPFRTMAIDYIMGRADPAALCRKMLSLMENYPPESFYGAFNIIGGHDRMRILSVLGGMPEDMSGAEQERYRLSREQRDIARRRLKLLSVMQYAVPGVPCLYYGDEAGLEGGADPYNRGTYPWGREDAELLYHYRVLGSIYNEHNVLRSGSFCPIDMEQGVFGFWRENEEERVLFLSNPDLYKTVTVTVSAGEDTYALELLTARELTVENGSVTAEIPPCTAFLVLMLKNAPERVRLDRSAGVICHISSLPSEGKRGALGKSARDFVDFLHDSGMRLWQILPLNPTGEGGSAYMSPAVFAGNPDFIDRSELPDMSGYEDFCRENAFWLEDYAVFTALQERFGDIPWQKWPEDARDRTDLNKYRALLAERIDELKREQYYFFSQWDTLRAYANGKGISVVGDLPIYVSPSGADTWAQRENFQLDAAGYMTSRAGVPPDYFAADGQDWQMPLYDWRYMEKDGYRWWTERLRTCVKRYDYVRLDHFRSFSAYYAIPQGKTAKEGYWQPGAGLKFFKAVRKELGSVGIIAEDLGDLDEAVYDLVKLSGCPGMEVWQFTRERMERMTAREASDRLFYAGTHDNQTLVGWCRETMPGEEAEAEAEEIMEKLYASPAPWAMLQLQDMLLLDDSARLNVPGTPEGNWMWRADKALLTPETAKKFRLLAEKYGR